MFLIAIMNIWLMHIHIDIYVTSMDCFSLSLASCWLSGRIKVAQIETQGQISAASEPWSKLYEENVHLSGLQFLPPPSLWHHIWDTSQFGLGLRRWRRRRLAAHSWSSQCCCCCCCLPWLCLMTAVYSGTSGPCCDWLERRIAMCQWVRKDPRITTKKI